jgi:hypothetical protein
MSVLRSCCRYVELIVALRAYFGSAWLFILKISFSAKKVDKKKLSKLQKSHSHMNQEIRPQVDSEEIELFSIISIIYFRFYEKEIVSLVILVTGGLMTVVGALGQKMARSIDNIIVKPKKLPTAIPAISPVGRLSFG